MKLNRLPHWLSPVFFALAASVSASGATWSDLWGDPAAPTWDPDNSRLLDFTNVGYKGGAEPIPDWPVWKSVTEFGAIPDDGLDDSQAFIEAIAACPDDHAILVPEGRFTILQEVNVQQDHFVLRGEDMYTSVIFFPKYRSEVYIDEIGYQPGKRNPVYTGLFILSGGVEQSIENLTFEFREERKDGDWDYPGAQAISMNGRVLDSWFRNLYIKNADSALKVSGERISVLNIVLDQFNGRQNAVNNLDAYGGILPRNVSYSLFHNIHILGRQLQPVDLNENNTHNVFSHIRVDAMNNRTAAYHGGSSSNNLYTDLNAPVAGNKISNRSYEVYWGVKSAEQDWFLNYDDVHGATNHSIYVGFGNDWDATFTDSIWYEPAAYGDLAPGNLYLAQLDYFGEPLPEVGLPMLPAPYEREGSVFRMLPTDDVSPGKSADDTLTTGAAYLKFDLSAANEPVVAHARLRLTLQAISKPPFELTAWMVTDDNWSEDTLTSENQPSAVSALASTWIEVDTTNPVVEFDVTDFVRDQLVGGDGVISFFVERSAGNGSFTSFWSSEQGIHPELIVERTASLVPDPPSAPAGIRSTPLLGNIILDWEDNPELDVATYSVYRTPYQFGGLPIAAGLVSSDHVDTSSSPSWRSGMMEYDQVYHYWVTAVDAHGYESAKSLEFVAATLHPSNSPPSFDALLALPAATARTTYSGDLATLASDPEFDPMYFMKVSGPDWLQLALDGTLSGEPSIADAGSNTFTFQVTAIGGSTLRESVTMEVLLPADDPAGAPGVPTGLSGTVDNNVAALSWDVSPEADLYGYQIFRATTSGDYGPEPVATVFEPGFVDFEVSNGTDYFYTIKAVDRMENVSLSSVELTLLPADVAPAAPAELSADPEEARVRLSWGADSGFDPVSYTVYRSIIDGDVGLVQESGITATEYVDNSAANGTTYYYTVVAVDAGGHSSPESAQVAATPVNAAPPQVMELVANARDGGVFLDWAHGAAADLASYTVYRADSSGAYGEALMTGIESNYYLDKSVSNGSTYFYVVTAVDTGDLESLTYSDEASATPMVGIAGSTVFIGQELSGATDNWINTSENWDNRLPILQQGTIAIDAKYDSRVELFDYRILHEAGTLTLGGGFQGLKLGEGTIWEMNGPLAAIPGIRGIRLANAQFTLNNGVASLANNGASTQVSGALGRLVINGGTMSVANLAADTGGQLVVNGGTLNVASKFSTGRFTPSGGFFQFNGGTITGQSFDLGKPGLVTFGGQRLGSLTLTDGLGTGADFDWLPGSRMRMSVPLADEWAEAAWNAGILTYDGQGVGELGTWAAVTASGGLDGTGSFVYDSATETLALGSVDPLDVTPPAVPEGLSASANDGTVHLDWVDNDEADFERFNVYRSTSPGSGYTLFESTGLSSAYFDSWAVNDTTYYYVVTAVDTSGNESAFSVEVSATPADRSPPPAPSGLSGEALDGEVWLDWSDLTAADFASYKLYRSTRSGSDYELIADAAEISAYQDTALTNGFTYFYVVTAADTSGNESAYSNELSLTPSDLDSPLTPAGLRVVVSDGQVQLDWNDNADRDLAGYTVLRADSGSGVYTVIASGLVASEFADAGLTNGNTYHYRVSAVDSWGNESPRTTVVAATPTAAPVRFGTNFVLSGGVITEAASWDNGLPVGQRGLITLDALALTDLELDGYDVLQSAGLLSQSGVPRVTLSNGSRWLMNGASVTTTTGFRGFHISTGSSFILRNGTAYTGPGRDWLAQDAGSSISIEGGLFNLARKLELSGTAGPSFSMNGGTLVGDPLVSSVGANQFANNEKTFNFNGGATTVYALDLRGDNTSFNFGGDGAGSLTAQVVSGPFGANTVLNFRPGTQMRVSLSDEDEWAAVLWDTGQLRFNDQGVNDFGSWAAVTAPGGLLDGFFFAYDSATETLSVVSGDAEPVYTDAENWRLLYFEQSENSGAAADLVDADGDGLSNLLERAFGTSPVDAASSVRMPFEQMVDWEGSNYLSITYRRLTGGSGTTGVDYTADGMTYTVEHDADLVAPWSTGSVLAVSEPIDNGDGTETVTVRLLTATEDAESYFMRLHVTAAP